MAIGTKTSAVFTYKRECPMSYSNYIENLNKYLKLFSDYDNFLISAIDFERGFSELWEADTEAIYEKSKNWERRFDIELQKKLREGKISLDEFNKRWNDLWGITGDESALSDILDPTYSVCDCFYPEISEDKANPPLVLSEKLFREEILILYHELKIFMEKHNDT